MFKTHNDSDFEKYLRDKIKEQNIKIDSKKDFSHLDTDLERKAQMLRHVRKE